MTNALNQYTSVGGAAYAYDGNGNMTYDGDGMMYAYDPENRLTTVNKIDGPLSPGCDIALSFTSGGDAAWVLDTNEYSYDHDSARSGDIGDDQETWLQTTVTGPGTLTFDYKLSCDAGDEYAFSIDGQYRSGRAGSKDWTESGPWTISGAGTHTIRWKFIKDSSGSSGSDCLWIDRIRWTGAMPDGEGWDRIEYAYDAAGRRIEKKVDGATQVKYVYDGDHIIAEYNNAGTLLRKYVHGPCVDEPICMIEASGTYAGTHYYHYDALGSCVAMTNSAGNVTQLYEYSVYGQVAASDENHPNRFMFTGREFDKDTGLYYYRARYYHPEIGRFLQTDPIGYGDGMNWYAYCGNNSQSYIDPFGLCDICGYDGPCIYPENINDPCWTWATGKMMILPYRLDPQFLSTIENLSAYIAAYKALSSWKGHIGFGIDIWNREWGKIMKGLTDPTSRIAGIYIDALEGLVNSLPGFAAEDKKAWRAFIEVQPHKWKRGGDKVDEHGFTLDADGHRIMEKDKPYWVEVVGLAGYYETGQNPGYETMAQAYAAAVKGISFWRCYKLGQGRTVPRDWWTSDTYMARGSIYRDDKPYYYDGDVPLFGL